MTDDIEKLLQQYGEDRRQQLKVAAELRRMARRRTIASSALACVAVLIATAFGVSYFMSPETPLLACHNLNLPLSIINYQPADSTEEAIETPPAHHKAVVYKKSCESTTVSPSAEINEEIDKPDFQIILADSRNEVDESEKKDETPSPSDEYANNTIEEIVTPIVSIGYNPSEHQTQLKKESRFRFIASVGANATSSIGGSDRNIVDSHGNGLTDNETHMTINPLSTFSANVGMAYTVAGNERQHIDVGIAFSGHAQKSEVMVHGLENLSVDQIVDDEQPVEIIDYSYSINTFNVYAGIPLTFTIRPIGTDKMGWNMSLTPAHRISTQKHIGSMHDNPFEPNPWKLTLGIGLSFPNQVLSHLNITANLLPLYTSQFIHEIGIEIGF